MTQYADETEVADFASELPDAFLWCRRYGHNWRPYTATIEDHGYEETARCSRCKTRKVETLSTRGAVLASRLLYPEGYLARKLGRIVGGGRDTLRLEGLKRHLEKVK